MQPLVRRIGRGALAALAVVALAGSGWVAGRAPDTAWSAPGAAPTVTGEAHALAVQPDGKLVAAGRALNALGDGNWTFALARYSADGALDPTFGQRGRVVTRVNPIGSEAYAVAVQPDGKIVAAGRAYTRAPEGAPVFAVVRYLPDGQLDAGFGDGGIVTTALGTDATARGVAVQPDGRIVVAGVAKTQADTDFGVARYLPDGQLDASFGQGGLLGLDFARADDEARAVVLQPDGKILLAGLGSTGGNSAFALFRLTPEGQPDPAFGPIGNGGVGAAVGGWRSSGAHAVALQPDSKIVAAGWANFDGFGYRFAVVRYRPDGAVDQRVEGQPDTGFGDGGVAGLQLCSGCVNDRAHAVAIQADGKIVAAGHSKRPSGFVAAAVRYLPTGQLDPTYGGGGQVATLLGSDGWTNALALQPDGKLVAGGWAGPVGKGDFALVRYDPSGGVDPAFGSNGSTITPFDGLAP